MTSADAPPPSSPPSAPAPAPARRNQALFWGARGVLASFVVGALGVGVIVVGPGAENPTGFFELGPVEEVGLWMLVLAIGAALLCGVVALGGLLFGGRGSRRRFGKVEAAAALVVGALVATWVLIGVLNNGDQGVDHSVGPVPADSWQSPGSGPAYVHFSVQGRSDDDFGWTEVAPRPTDLTDRAERATYAVEQLIAGPTAAEREQQKLFSPLTGKLTGTSNCGGADFTLGLKAGVVRFQFCRTVTSAGVGDDARIGATLRNTIDATTRADRIVVLDAAGGCFGDESGTDSCLA
jgi:hypothetical protein